MGEQLLTENPGNLPPLWHVLYYEGIRGHHILFAPGDMDRFDRQPGLFRFSDDETRDRFTSLMTEFLQQPSLSEMKLFIQSQPFQMREAIYRFYKGWLRRWGDHLKTVLN
ncbi:MAG: hypothetical protein AB8G05_20350 [Oligoflexales bacterium]